MIAFGVASRASSGRDLGVGVGHGEDDRLVGHAADHVLGHRALHREAEEHVGAVQRVGQRARVGGGGVRRLPLVHALGAALVDHAAGVAQHDVFGAHAHRLQQLDAGNAGRTGAVHHQLGVAEFAAGEVARVDQARGGDDGGAVLVVVEHRDVHELAQALLDDEALGSLDVFQVDAAEAGEEADGVDHVVDVLGIDFEIDAVDVGEALEQGDLAFHHRLGRDGAQVAEAEDGGSIGNHRDHVALRRVVVGERGVALDVQAGFGDTGRIREREVARGGDRLGDARFQLARAAGGVQGERFLGRDVSGAGIDAAISHWSFPCETRRSGHHGEKGRVREAGTVCRRAR